MMSTRMFVQAIAALLAINLAAALPKPYPRFSVSQKHFEVLGMRVMTEVNPAALLETTCLDRNRNIVFHDQNVAELAICGGIAGDIQKCNGNPESTIGQSGSAKFTLTPTRKGAKINISKGRWEACVRAARAVCPTGSFKAVCAGGATSGDVLFTLENP